MSCGTVDAGVAVPTITPMKSSPSMLESPVASSSISRFSKESRNESRFIGHGACSCGSSDGLAIYTDHTYCFVCNTYTKTTEEVRPTRSDPIPPMTTLTIEAWTDQSYRGLSKRVLEQYGILRTADGVVFQYRDAAGKVIAQKFRSDDKRISWKGDAKNVVGFGHHLANPSHHDAIAICEGEFDAPSIYAASNGKVVGISVPNGAQSAAAWVRKHLDQFNQFKIVYIATDNDEPGEAAASALVELFEAGQVRRVVFPCKDANDCLQELGGQAVKESIYAAKQLRPDGIKPASAYEGIVLKPAQRTALNCAFTWWNQKTPFYDNQLIVLIAGSGIGKTTFARALALHDMENGIKVGWIGLEETAEEAIFRFVGMAAGLQLHARQSYAGLTDQQLQHIAQADKFVTGSGMLELFDHFGSLDENVILQRMNYMVRSLGCQHIYLDHLTIIGSGLAQDVRQLDALITKIRSFIAATKCTVFAISHLNRGSSQVKNMEDGGVPELHDIRGSHSVVQLADTIWALGRKRGTQLTHSYCLKNRMLGRCGYAGSFVFDEETQALEQKWEDQVLS
jgi:twinkle protein